MSIAKVETSLTHVPLESGSDPTAMGKKIYLHFQRRMKQKEHFISCSVFYLSQGKQVELFWDAPQRTTLSFQSSQADEKQANRRELAKTKFQSP